MKNTVIVLLLSLVMSHPAFALVRLLANCTTPDQYTVQVVDNQGIGPIRTSNIGGVIRDPQGVPVAVYKLEVVRRGSVSFGRSGYEDAVSHGASFLLLGPSTNFQHHSVTAQTNTGGNSFTLQSDDLYCSVFGGVLSSN